MNYKEMIDNTSDKQELESILKQVENDESISDREYDVIRRYVINKMYV